MSQRVQENPNPKASVTPKQKVPEPPTLGLSPDDPIGVSSGDTGKEPAPAPRT